MCDVTVHNTRVISSSYMSTTPSVQTVTRGTGTALQVFAETAETLTISTGRDLGVLVDWGDWYQSPWTKGAELFDRIGALLNEYIESAVLARHASWTDFGTSSIGGGGSATNPITVSASNIDDIIRAVKREIRVGNGQKMMNQYGVGFVWRAADFEYLEAKPDIGLVKSPLIDLETQKWATGGKQISPYFKSDIVQPERLNMGTLVREMR